MRGKELFSIPHRGRLFFRFFLLLLLQVPNSASLHLFDFMWGDSGFGGTPGYDACECLRPPPQADLALGCLGGFCTSFLWFIISLLCIITWSHSKWYTIQKGRLLTIPGSKGVGYVGRRSEQGMKRCWWAPASALCRGVGSRGSTERLHAPHIQDGGHWPSWGCLQDLCQAWCCCSHSQEEPAWVPGLLACTSHPRCLLCLRAELSGAPASPWATGRGRGLGKWGKGNVSLMLSHSSGPVCLLVPIKFH